MSDTPIQRKPPPKLDRVLAAHIRRTRLIAQLLEQAVASANNDLSTQQNAIKGDITRHTQWQEADWMIAAAILKMIAAAIFVAAQDRLLPDELHLRRGRAEWIEAALSLRN
jgi:hypothetical protein